MRKIITTLLILVVSVTTQAQSLMDMFSGFGGSSSKSEEVKNEPIPLSQESILGSWSYTKLAVDLADDSPLKGFAGNIAVGQVANILNGVSSGAGIQTDMFSATFNDSRSVVFNVKEDNSTTRGKYSINEELNSVDIKVSDIGSVKVGKLTAKVTIYKDKMILLFAAEDLIAIADEIPSIAEDSQYQMVKGLITKFEGVLLGFELSKI